MHSRSVSLVDETGGPLDPRIERVLMKMLPRFRRQFPSFRDEVALVDVLEEAARRIARREARLGAIAHLPGYAWVTLRTVATSMLRRGDARIMERIVPSAEGAALLSVAGATSHTAADLERRVLHSQVLALLTPSERRVCALKAAGFSTQQIARSLRRSATSIDTLFSRAKAKARRLAETTTRTGSPQMRGDLENGSLLPNTGDHGESIPGRRGRSI